MFCTSHGARFSTLFAAAALLAACGDSGAPVGLAPDDALQDAVGTTLLECPAGYEIVASARIHPHGGTVRLRNHRMTVPSRAIERSTEFRVSAPESSFMEVAITPEGGGHYRFKRPVTITIDYSRCPPGFTDKRSLTVWHIDGETKELLEHMGGVDDKAARTITFQSDHLSHFSIAQ